MAFGPGFDSRRLHHGPARLGGSFFEGCAPERARRDNSSMPAPPRAALSTRRAPSLRRGEPQPPPPNPLGGGSFGRCTPETGEGNQLGRVAPSTRVPRAQPSAAPISDVAQQQARGAPRASEQMSRLCAPRRRIPNSCRDVTPPQRPKKGRNATAGASS